MGDNFKVDSNVKRVENEKSKKQEEEFQNLKKKEEEDKLKAEKKREDARLEKEQEAENLKKAQETKKLDSNELAATLVKGGVTLLSNMLAKKMKKWMIFICIGIVIIIGILLFPRIYRFFNPPQEPVYSTYLGETDGIINHSMEIRSVILGEAREKQDLIVMEQDVEVETKLETSLANLEIFKKTKNMISCGTGVYTVDMSKISDDTIVVDNENMKVTIIIPHTVLQYTNIDPSKTKFQDTQKGLLALGDLKLTPEEQNMVNESIVNSMKTELNSEDLFKKTDEIAILKVREIFQPLVSAISEEFIVEVVQ